MTTTFPNLFDSFMSPSIWDSKEWDSYWKEHSTQQFNTPYPYNSYRDQEGNSILEFALAGFSKNDIDIELVNNRLKLKVEFVEHDKEEKQYFVKGIARRKMECAFNLSETCDVDNLTSTFENGMLKIVIPTKQPKSHKVAIQ